MTGIVNALAGAGGASALYVFTNATFTPGGQTGATGPSLAQARTGLTGTGVDAWKNNTAFFNTSSGIQLWTVPATGTYRIVANGARGGPSPYATAGFGASMQGDFALNAGDKIRILVGQGGITGSNYGGGGGGGTFVMKEVGSTTADIYVIAGAGGGGGYSSSPNGGAGQTGNNGQTSPDGLVAGGTAGSGGNAPTSGLYTGAGGGGLLGNGVSSNNQGPANGGLAFVSGGAGGLSEGTINATKPDGGFGGGGAGVVSGGGGGGYSGGGGGGQTNFSAGGGGGSYNNGANQVNTAGANNGDGSVTVTAL